MGLFYDFMVKIYAMELLVRLDMMFEADSAVDLTELGALDIKTVLAEAVECFLKALNESAAPRLILPMPEGRWEYHYGSVHPFLTEMFFQLQGGCGFALPTQNIELHPGDILLIPNGMPHRELSNNFRGRPFANLVLSAGESVAAVHLGVSRGHSRKPEIFDGVKLGDPGFYLALASALSHWPAHLSRTENEIRSLLLRTLLLKLRQDVEAATERLSFQPVTASGSPLARRARQLIDAAAPEHFPGLPEIAARLGCSPNHLSMVFHREHGETVKNYVTGLKLRYAHRMLEDSDFNISEIAARCGFADPGYFARVFRKRFGRSPSAVR